MAMTLDSCWTSERRVKGARDCPGLDWHLREAVSCGCRCSVPIRSSRSTCPLRCRGQRAGVRWGVSGGCQRVQARGCAARRRNVHRHCWRTRRTSVTPREAQGGKEHAYPLTPERGAMHGALCITGLHVTASGQPPQEASGARHPTRSGNGDWTGEMLWPILAHACAVQYVSNGTFTILSALRSVW